MTFVKKTFIAAVMTAVAAVPAFAQDPPQTPPPQNPPAQTPPPQNPPKPQTPPTQPPTGTQPPAGEKPAPPPQPPKPFPEGAKIAFVDLQLIASNSNEGKAASAKIQDLNKKKAAEIQGKQKEAQGLQTKLQQSGTVLSDQARQQTEKDLQKLQRQLQDMQEDAQQEIQELQNKLQLEFQERLNPIIDQVATEKGLHIVLSARDSGILWGYSGIDLSAEVIKRLDSGKTLPAKK